MPRTTLNIDAPILKDLKRLQKGEKRPLGALVTELLVEALHERSKRSRKKAPAFRWIAKDMGKPFIDTGDPRVLKEFLMDEDVARSRR